jgi:hypothetical protein
MIHPLTKTSLQGIPVIHIDYIVDSTTADDAFDDVNVSARPYNTDIKKSVLYGHCSSRKKKIIIIISKR